MESSVLIVQVSKDAASSSLAERKNIAEKSFEGGDASMTISDLCKSFPSLL